MMTVPREKFCKDEQTKDVCSSCF